MVIVKYETLSNFLKALNTVQPVYIKDITTLVSEICDCAEITDDSNRKLRGKKDELELTVEELNKKLEEIEVKAEADMDREAEAFGEGGKYEIR